MLSQASAETYVRSVQLLRDSLEAKLQEYATSAAEDEAALNSVGKVRSHRGTCSRGLAETSLWWRWQAGELDGALRPASLHVLIEEKRLILAALERLVRSIDY
jgi:hypothetical protein